MSVTVRSADRDDAGRIAAIYNDYIADTCITFETDPVTVAEMAERIQETQQLSLPWLVAEENGHLCGYAYASRWKGRCAYRFSVEATIYLNPESTGKGIGIELYSALIAAIKAASMRSVIGGIALPNEASIKLHERLGFRKVGHFEKVGFKHDRWVDVGYWQLQL